MNFGSEPEIQVELVSGAVRVSVRPQLDFGALIALAWTAIWAWFALKDWSRLHGLSQLAFSLIACFAMWELLRRLLSDEMVEISRQTIVIRRSWIFGGNRTYSSQAISDFGIGFTDERKAAVRYLCFRHKWLEVQFALGISESDANRVMEAVGELGAIGKESTSDPFGTDKSLTTLNLNS